MLYDNPPHSITLYGPPTAANDSAGGTNLTWGTTKQSAVPCSINTASASEIELFAQQGIAVSHTIAILTSELTTAAARGDKAIADDTSDAFHIEGIRAGRSYGNIPPFTYLTVRQLLG